jgi:hypothetical protein
MASNSQKYALIVVAALVGSAIGAYVLMEQRTERDPGVIALFSLNSAGVATDYNVTVRLQDTKGIIDCDRVHFFDKHDKRIPIIERKCEEFEFTLKLESLDIGKNMVEVYYGPWQE